MSYTAEQTIAYAKRTCEAEDYTLRTGALSEASLISMEDLFKSYLDENGHPWPLQYASSYSYTLPTMSTFKKGDIIRPMYNIKGNDWVYQSDETYLVKEVGSYSYGIEVVIPSPYHPADLGKTLYPTLDKVNANFTLISPSPSTPMGILQIIRNTFTWVFGSKEEKLLRKTGLKDNNGNFTDEARQAYLETLMQEDVANKKSVLLDMATTIKRERDEEECC